MASQLKPALSNLTEAPPAAAPAATAQQREGGVQAIARPPATENHTRRLVLSLLACPLAMFPILVAAYVHLAQREEREVAVAFGEECNDALCRTHAGLHPAPETGGGALRSDWEMAHRNQRE